MPLVVEDAVEKGATVAQLDYQVDYAVRAVVVVLVEPQHVRVVALLQQLRLRRVLLAAVLQPLEREGAAATPPPSAAEDFRVGAGADQGRRA